MLICIVCKKVIANCDNGKVVRYGGCSACDLKEVARLMDQEKRIRKYEDEGCTRSDAQGIIMAEDLTKERITK